MSLKECHKLLARIDRVVEFNALKSKCINRVTLDPLDYKVFAQHNSARDDGTYHYRSLLICQKQVKK